MDTPYLAAVSLGYLVLPRFWRQRWYQVHSSFEHALNLTWGPHTFCTLLSAASQNLPMGIRIDTPPGWDWRLYSTAGQVVDYRDGMLSTQRWQVDLQQVEHWQPDELSLSPSLQSLNYALHQHDLMAAQLQQYCADHQIQSQIRLLPTMSGTGLLPNLPLNAEPHLLQATVLQLLGFGGGLTPDGDDYLIGYLAALMCWYRPGAIAKHLFVLKQVINANMDNTTIISRHYLALALEGHYSQSIQTLISLITRNSAQKEISISCQLVMQSGSASGVDTLAGFLHGLRTLKSSMLPTSSYQANAAA